MSSANIRESLIAFGGIAQTNLATANMATDLLRVNKLNAAVNDFEATTEDDALEIGKPSEFAQSHFVTSWGVRGTLEKYLSSEMASWLFAFGLGDSVVTVPAGGTLAHQHAATVQDTAVEGLDMKAFSVLEQARPGSSYVIDRLYPGCVLEDFTMMVQSGAGRASSKFTANYVGTGKVTTPSSYTMPSPLVEHLLPAASLALSVNGVDYVSGGQIMEAEFTFKNNVRLDTGFYPGSGFQTTGDSTSGQIRGRMELGDRSIGVRFVARYAHGSAEYTKLLQGTEGSLAWNMTGALIEGTIKNSLSIAMGRIYFARVKNSNANGIITVEVDASILLPADFSGVSGLVTATTINQLAKVGSET